MKKISVITINYNNRQGLEETIQSVERQTYKNYEYIVIDGGSTDGSTEVIRQYAEHIDYWVSESDRGVYHAMNKGIEKATGEYLNFMNSGDTFYDENVLQTVSEAEEADILAGRLCLSPKGTVPEQYSLTFPRINTYLLYSTTLPHQAAFIKRKLFDGHLYDENLKIVSDWKFFLEAIVFRGCSARILPHVIARYDTNGISSDHTLLHREKRQVLEELFPPGILSDYDQINRMGMNMIENMIYLNRYDTFRRYVYYITTLLVRIHKKFTSFTLAGRRKNRA